MESKSSAPRGGRGSLESASTVTAWGASGRSGSPAVAARKKKKAAPISVRFLLTDAGLVCGIPPKLASILRLRRICGARVSAGNWGKACFRARPRAAQGTLTMRSCMSSCFGRAVAVLALAGCIVQRWSRNSYQPASDFPGAVHSGRPKVMIVEPTASVTICRPSTEYVTGDVLMVAFRGSRHSVLPSRSSAARK
jgi:hypothetical protein